jgi:hypothetical protein
MNLLGLMAQESARHAKAIRYFSKAIAVDHNAACHYNIGSSYEALNERDKAAAFSRSNCFGDEPGPGRQSSRHAGCCSRRRPRPHQGGVAATAKRCGIVRRTQYRLTLFCCGLETIRLSGLVAERLLTEARYALLRVATESAPISAALILRFLVCARDWLSSASSMNTSMRRAMMKPGRLVPCASC